MAIQDWTPKYRCTLRTELYSKSCIKTSAPLSVAAERIERDGRTKRSFAPAVDRARRRSARHSRVVSATLEGARVAASARVTMNAASAEDEDEE